MSASGVNFSGLGSGIDTESIITQTMALKHKSVDRIQKQITDLQSRQTAIKQVSALLTGFQSASQTLNNSDSFKGVKASSSDTNIATVSASTGALSGSHTMQVMQLAQGQRLGSKSLASQTDALGVSGQIVINGKAIDVSGSDSLETLAGNINTAAVGVNASIVSTSSNAYTLVLSAKNTGTANDIQLADTAGGTILQNTLGLISGVTTSNTSGTNTVSHLFTDSASSVGTMLGLTSPQAGDVQFNGVSVHIDLATDSLTAIIGKINAAGTGATAKIATVNDPTTGISKQQIQIGGVTSVTDANNVLSNIGILSNTPSTELMVAKDAQVKLDGLTVTRSNNSISDMLNGVNINLVSDTNQPTINISINTDTDAIQSNIQNFVSSFNQMVKTIKNYDAYDAETKKTGILFGDNATQSVLDSATEIVTNSVAGATGSVTMLADMGITLDQNNLLNVDSSMLSNAVNSHLSEVERVFRAMGSASDSSIQYVISSDKTIISGKDGYAVNIEQLASQASASAILKHTADDNPNVETLTFSGGSFGSGHSVFLKSLSSLDGIVSMLNADTAVSQMLTASNVNGLLSLTSKQYGAGFGFTVISNLSAAANNSGIGNTAINAIGKDVQGTINGKLATGSGRSLTGNSGNQTTDGLRIMVNSTTVGAHGSMVITRGLADQIVNFGKTSTDYLNGTLTQYSNSIDQQVTELKDNITRQEALLKDEEDYMRQTYSAMDSAVATIKGAAKSLASLTPTTTSSTSG